MDAPDDRDIRFQRASGDLLKEFEDKLTPLLWKQNTIRGQSQKTVHRWSQVPKENRLIEVLERFQEWPQLLDSKLQPFLSQLVDAFLVYLTKNRQFYGSTKGRAPSQTQIVPLPRSICRIIYTFCKVRGVKVISRFLNNEPKYLDLMLRVFIEWDSIKSDEESKLAATGINVQPLRWEERYVMLLWLSHLLLAPFDLTSLSSDNIPVPYDDVDILESIPLTTPRIAKAIISIAVRYVVTAGKEREAATLLLARLVLRPDMQRLGLLNIFTDWAFSVIQPPVESETLPPVYTCIGVLSFLARLGVSGQVEDLAPLVTKLFDKSLRIAQGNSGICTNIRSSASARKMLIKILRTSATLALTLAEKGDPHVPEDKVSFILEESIDFFLVTLADKDMPVRFAASKALAVVALKLDADMSADIVDAVTGSLNEDILYQKNDGGLVTAHEAQNMNMKDLKRNLSAVDPHRWQGLILTLAHLLFRRAPPPRQLPEILQGLVSGLDFEQRSATGSSVGTGVRDASCFGIWAVSRKYTTKELLSLNTGTVKAPTEQEERAILQMLAVELVCAACIDPSGNIRRGASAALQELIGRHPDTILEGIPLVQVVDYHAVARRSKAMIEVAQGAALIDSAYWSPLVNSLLFWRGIGSSDADSRRTAATALGELCKQDSFKSIQTVLQRLNSRLLTIAPTDVETRHGCLLAYGAVVDAFTSEYESNLKHENAETVKEMILQLWEVFNSSHGPTKNDLTQQNARPELTAEAVSCLIASLARATGTFSLDKSVPESLLLKVLNTMLLCVSRGEDVAINASSGAASQLFRILPLEKQEETVRGWFANIHASWKSASGRGQISALGAVFHRLPSSSSIREYIIKELIHCTKDEEFIEKRVSAVQCLASGVLPDIQISDSLAEHIVEFLTDYTTDRRGDIGSFIRIEAIQAVQVILDQTKAQDTADGTSAYIDRFIGCLCRLAAEKLDKVRFQAWVCLQQYWGDATHLPAMERKFEHFSQVSSFNYFHQLLKLLQVENLRRPLVQGLITSASAGTEGLIQSSRFALIDFIENQPNREKKYEWVNKLIENLVSILETNLVDDRYTIPALEVSAFFLDTYISEPLVQANKPCLKKLFLLTQKAHFKSSNIPRLEAAIKVYASLSRATDLRVDVLKKLTAMLLHPYPKIRIAVSDSLFMTIQSDLVKNEDWTVPPKELKVAVERLRGELLKGH
ncbi:tubulin-specific chaperone D, putative [Talaromyces stipitatus ATCC 10500]|uniref:Tubulin-specific chaperone D, putative n=1 Tax=Talaromyces stipitatus (strain ATCC 10500 / CBS 375.48 / QM 6759 / NRRL 1006) TaxID=441959 RepID=B8LXH6_TALSN|nr:tubulin-specific chaperone D, putative [Talaromyces stipitatus ATCC 10500]EED23257.1 tubulin-specific chaperone D, putative [Talaromyces stipitatus ATCC 10500]